MGVGFRRRSQFHSIYMSRENNGALCSLDFSPLKYSAIVCFVAVACGLDDVSNNRLRCADVPGIRPPFSYKLILLIKVNERLNHDDLLLRERGPLFYRARQVFSNL